MNAIKEALYECTYASAQGLRTAHFMAWDSREAVEMFAHELQAEGVAERGIIQVRARGDRQVQVRNADYPLL
jgi:hypothetical protein